MDYEISFETAFLDSHFKAFVNILQKYERKSESILGLSKVSFLSNSLENISICKGVEEENIESILNQQPFKGDKQKCQYLEDLKTE